MEIKGTLDRFEEKDAIIKTGDGLEIRWPIKLLPDGLNAGSVVKLSVSAEEEPETQNQAKNILNEILNDQDNSAV